MKSVNPPAPPPTFRIVKKVTHHAPHHGGAWKVAYADFVTAMMALFIVLWIVGQSEQVKNNIARYFQSPGAFKEGGASILAGDATQPIDPVKDTKEVIPSSAKEHYAIIERMKEEQVLSQAGDRLWKRIGANAKFKQLADQINIRLTPDGLRIELTEKQNSELFEIGESRPKSATVELLTVIAKELVSLPNLLSLEGHTDGRPFVGRAGYSNWELSADRANSARRIMEAAGIPTGQIEAIRGYADRQPLAGKDPLDMRNRRVSILVRPRVALPIPQSPQGASAPGRS